MCGFIAQLVFVEVTGSNPVEALIFFRLLLSNGPRSIYQYSNMAPRLSGQTSIFDVVFFVFKSLLGIEGQKKLENLQFWPESLGVMLEYWYIERGLLRKLENLLRWSLFTFIYNRSTNMNYFIYISHSGFLPTVCCHAFCMWHWPIRKQFWVPSLVITAFGGASVQPSSCFTLCRIDEKLTRPKQVETDSCPWLQFLAFSSDSIMTLSG